jgi:tagaturonate epimerase
MSTDPVEIEPVEDFDLYPRSRVNWEGSRYFMAQKCSTRQKFLGVQGDTSGFNELRLQRGKTSYYACDPRNARLLRERLPWMKPQPGGLKTSFGFGDRLGLASPGHALAAWDAGLFPIFAQQSVRENTRTGRTPQQVVDEALWGIFQLGWGKPWGADADHLKSTADLEAFIQAGYTFYTVDPGEYVGQQAETASPGALKSLAANLPWSDLDSSPEQAYREYLERRFSLDGAVIEFNEPALLRALVKYGGAVAHAARMYRELVERTGGKDFDFEVSVDETESPTRPEEHFFIASELRRLGVKWNSLAPRFPGRFEKGVDFIGDLHELEVEMARHAAILNHFGNYKLSLHSGSDKFSVYALLARYAGRLVHVKTAGTSYLEALRVAAQVKPDFFRQVLDFSIGRYLTDRASYHVSAELARVPRSEKLEDRALAELLDDFHARQVLHVTFGSVLAEYGAELKTLLAEFEAEYSAGLLRHFKRHLEPFLL